MIDGSEMSEVLAGTPRPIRSDDWLVGLPLALAQRAHEPAFPRVNRNIGDGQDMLLMELPIAHPATFFRPASWGFFLGADTGIAWMWWLQLLGLFAAWLLALLTVARGGRDLASAGGGDVALAAAGALLVTVSPFMQFWSLAPARVATYAALCITAWGGLGRARTLAGAVAWGALLGWAAGCFALVLYPPFQVPLFWVAAAAAGGLLVERLRAPSDPRLLRLQLGGALLAAAIALAAAGGFWLAAEPSIERMLGTVYPGRRSFTGGGLPPWRLLGHDLFLAAWVEDWSAWINVSEGGGFWLVAPLAALGVRRGGRTDPVAAALLGCLTLLAAHALVGLPGWLARVTLLSQVQPERAIVGIAAADVLLLTRVLSPEAPLLRDRRLATAAAVVWTGALLACIPSLAAAFPEAPVPGLVAAAALNGAAAWALLVGLRPPLVLGSVAVLLAATTLGFNPLVRGGGDYLRENPLSRRILAIDRAAGGETAWLTYGSPFAANLFRTLGVRSLNGLLSLPQLEMWRRVDPEGRFARLTNRYAHFVAIASDGPGARFQMEGEATVALVAAPGSEAVRRLGATHLLIVAADPGAPDALPGIERIASHGWNHLYRVLPANAPGPSPR